MGRPTLQTIPPSPLQMAACLSDARQQPRPGGDARASIRRGLASVKAGHVRSAPVVFDRLRRRYGIPH